MSGGGCHEGIFLGMHIQPMALLLLSRYGTCAIHVERLMVNCE